MKIFKKKYKQQDPYGSFALYLIFLLLFLILFPITYWSKDK